MRVGTNYLPIGDGRPNCELIGTSFCSFGTSFFACGRFTMQWSSQIVGRRYGIAEGWCKLVWTGRLKPVVGHWASEASGCYFTGIISC